MRGGWHTFSATWALFACAILGRQPGHALACGRAGVVHDICTRAHILSLNRVICKHALANADDWRLRFCIVALAASLAGSSRLALAAMTSAHAAHAAADTVLLQIQPCLTCAALQTLSHVPHAHKEPVTHFSGALQILPHVCGRGGALPPLRARRRQSEELNLRVRHEARARSDPAVLMVFRFTTWCCAVQLQIPKTAWAHRAAAPPLWRCPLIVRHAFACLCYARLAALRLQYHRALALVSIQNCYNAMQETTTSVSCCELTKA